jgi:hypothetical protein
VPRLATPLLPEYESEPELWPARLLLDVLFGVVGVWGRIWEIFIHDALMDSVDMYSSLKLVSIRGLIMDFRNC